MKHNIKMLYEKFPKQGRELGLKKCAESNVLVWSYGTRNFMKYSVLVTLSYSMQNDIPIFYPQHKTQNAIE